MRFNSDLALTRANRPPPARVVVASSGGRAGTMVGNAAFHPAHIPIRPRAVAATDNERRAPGPAAGR